MSDTVTKEELMNFVNICLSAMNSCRAYPEEWFEEPSPLEEKVLRLSKYKWMFEERDLKS